MQINKDAGNDWFTLESNKTGTQWNGKCWYIHNFRKYEFDLEFEVLLSNICSEGLLQIPATYPTTAPELQLPELDGLTPKMYRFVNKTPRVLICKYLQRRENLSDCALQATLGQECTALWYRACTGIGRRKCFIRFIHF